jgi:hypothetical protein
VTRKTVFSTIIVVSTPFGFCIIPMLQVFASLWQEKSQDLQVNFIGALVGAFFGFIGAYLLYRLEIRNTARQEADAIKERHKEHIRYFSGILDDVVRYGNLQSSQVGDFVDRIKAQPAIIHRLGIVASDSIGRLNRADNESTFRAYNAVFAAEADREAQYKKLLSATDFLTYQLGEIKQQFHHYRDALYRHQRRFKELAGKSANEASWLLREAQRDPTLLVRPNGATPIALKELSDLLHTYNQLSDTGKPLPDYVPAFVNPLKQWLSRNDAWLPERGVNLRLCLRDTSEVFTDLVNESHNFLKGFGLDNLAGALQKVSELSEKLKQSSKS